MMKRGVKFGSYHTAVDWDMLLTDKSLTPPTPKTNYISVDGRDGDLDLSEALTGEIKFENRKAKYKFFVSAGTYNDRENLIAKILSVIHGRKLKIMIDDDPDHYMVGRCAVTDVKNINAYATMTVDATCEPWKYKVFETIRTVEVTGSAIELNCVNTGVKTVVPMLKVTGSINLEFDSLKIALSEGVFKVPELRLATGLKILTVSGNGALSVIYREAIL